MTVRLYYDDAYLREFEAQVISCTPVVSEAGQGIARFEIVLDRTAFYPTSGGQPHDTGRLGGAAVLEVLERAEDTLVQVCDRAQEKGLVHGVIHWERRFDHMQQHTGQHLLSAAFVELFGMQTVSFHLGRDASTIDLGARTISPQQVEDAERLTNKIIFEDRGVSVRYGSAAELEALGIRKQVDPELAGRVGPGGMLRAIEIAAFDRQPCGGTHVARTGEVGLLLCRKVEKQKQNWRVEFVCGGRALGAARSDFALLGEASRLLSCGLPEVPAVLKKTLEEKQAMHRARQEALERLAVYEARELLGGAVAVSGGGAQIVTHVFAEAEPGYLRTLATRMVSEPGVYALLGTQAGGNVLFARSSNLPTDMNQLLRETLAASGGKGGGSRNFAQGSVTDPLQLEQVLALAQSRLST